MIIFNEKKDCSGCGACSNVCPKQCISMVEDTEGFLYPQIDSTKCIRCDACENVCPIIKGKTKKTRGSASSFVAFAKDEQIRLASSSGGLFTLFAEIVIEQGGVVFGASFDESFNVKHTYAESIEDLSKFRGSKYAQSKIGDSYKAAKAFLDSGRIVFFTGTPCQIGGLYAYLRKDYDNLITQDLICHGVPSPMVWRKYLEYCEKSANSSIKKISFRDKTLGWKHSSLKIDFEDGKTNSTPNDENQYMQVFLKNYCLRPSCYDCAFKTIDRQADITLADAWYWGDNDRFGEMDDDKGISAVFINSQKGRTIFERIKDRIEYKHVDSSVLLKHNPAMVSSAKLPSIRDGFLKNVLLDGFEKAYDKAVKRIGILTYYHNSHNYGGLLQAYALCKFLNNSGYNAEQICYVPRNKPVINTVCKADTTSVNEGIIKRLLKKYRPKRVVKTLYLRVKSYLKRKKYRNWDLRFLADKEFQDKIPHSKLIYYKNTIKDSCEKYDCFITGSDQVWNIDWFDSAYFLDFVDKGKNKISYAASIGHSVLNDKQKSIFEKYLTDFDAISLREKSAADLIKSITLRDDIKWVLDPTLLLDKVDWDTIASDRLIKKDYVLCYFFGEDTNSRQIATEYANARGLKVVNLPHLYDYKITQSDIHFGDYSLFGVSPNDFISLIKYSECVFTNSFHACVFACIYQKEFFVFNRLDENMMFDRILSLCELFGCNDHFCSVKDKKNINYINKTKQIDYNKDFVLLKRMKEYSTKFLFDSWVEGRSNANS